MDNVIAVDFSIEARKILIDAIDRVGRKAAMEYYIAKGAHPSYLKVFMRHVLKFGA